MAEFKFRTTKNFDAIASHLSSFCGISRELTSKRLHGLKMIRVRLF
ncbi:MAG: hypothetical protein ACKO3K_04765 [Cuspidothrix sp.]